MEGVWQGGEYTVQHTDDTLLKCTLENLVSPLIN